MQGENGKTSFKKIGSGTLIAIALIGTILTVSTAGLVTTTQSVPTSGSITAISTVGVAVYSDAACTQPLTSVTWGNINPSSQTTRTIYVKNTGNVPETLSMNTNGWSPANSNSYLSCTWSPLVTTIAAGASTSATLTLAASSNAAITGFNFNVVITGTQ